MRPLFQAMVVSASLVLGISACSVVDRQQSTSAYASDSVVTTRVKAKFVEDPVVSAMRLSVETMNGVVLVSGFAKSTAEERRAIQLARSVEGVRSVRSGIEVRSGVQ